MVAGKLQPRRPSWQVLVAVSLDGPEEGEDPEEWNPGLTSIRKEYMTRRLTLGENYEYTAHTPQSAYKNAGM